jgi:hypothetical protein
MRSLLTLLLLLWLATPAAAEELGLWLITRGQQSALFLIAAAIAVILLIKRRRRRLGR